MFKKNKVLLIITLILSINLLSSVAHANIQKYQLGIISIQQEKSNWCWAASAEMQGRWAYSNATKTQWDIVRHLKGSWYYWYPNVGGSVNDTRLASESVTNNTQSFSSTTTMTMAQIRASIINVNPKPIIGGYVYYDENGTRIGGHMVVINGSYTESFGDTLGYIDPLDATQHWCTYDAFLDGSYNGGIYEVSVWY